MSLISPLWPIIQPVEVVSVDLIFSNFFHFKNYSRAWAYLFIYRRNQTCCNFLAGQESGGDGCVFPYIFEGETYYTCIHTGFPGFRSYKCSTRDQYEDGSYIVCTGELSALGLPYGVYYLVRTNPHNVCTPALPIGFDCRTLSLSLMEGHAAPAALSNSRGLTILLKSFLFMIIFYLNIP